MTPSGSLTRGRPYGSRPKSWFQRWEESRTLCIARLCMFAYACPNRTVRQAYVHSSDCFRRRPSFEQPKPMLSEYTQALLERIRSQQ